MQRRQCAGAAAQREEEERIRGKKKDTMVDEDSVHSVRCKLFFKKEKEFKEKGLGMLHLKVGEFSWSTVSQYSDNQIL